METPTKPDLAINCPESCTFSPVKIGQKNANALKEARRNGAGQLVFKRRAEELLGHPVHASTASRHLRAHYRELAPDQPQQPEDTGVKPSDLAILDSIISAGYRNSRNWKPSIKDTLDAMKLKVQMTGQSAFEDMIAAMDAALDLADGVDDEDEEAIEAPEALLSPDERGEEGE